MGLLAGWALVLMAAALAVPGLAEGATIAVGGWVIGYVLPLQATVADRLPEHPGELDHDQSGMRLRLPTQEGWFAILVVILAGVVPPLGALLGAAHSAVGPHHAELKIDDAWLEVRHRRHHHRLPLAETAVTVSEGADGALWLHVRHGVDRWDVPVAGLAPPQVRWLIDHVRQLASCAALASDVPGPPAALDALRAHASRS